MEPSHFAQHAGTAGTLFASVFVVATTTMRTMIPLRVFGILTNVVLIASSIPSHNYPTGLLHAVLLVLNSYRLHQMLQLVRDVKRSVNGDLSMEWLKPFMSERAHMCAPRHAVLQGREGARTCSTSSAAASSWSNRGIELPGGRHRRRTGHAVALERANPVAGMCRGRRDPERQLQQGRGTHVQNPAFGSYFLRLASARLFENIDKLEQRLAQHTAPAPVGAAPKPAGS